jgi:SAM-dependent methyltransferase
VAQDWIKIIAQKALMRCGHPKTGDALGMALWDAHDWNMNLDEVIETNRGDIWVNRFGTRMYFASYPRWPTHEKTAIARMKGSMLDIGCGAGRHSLHAQALLHQITAIDASFLASEVARRRGVREVHHLPIERAHELGKACFDTVLLLGNGLGLFGNFTRGRQYLRMLHRLTTRDGIIIGESVDHTNHRYLDEELCKASAQHTLHAQLRLRVRYRDTATPWFDYCYVSPNELETMIQSTGWNVREYHRGKQGRYAVILAKT